MYNNNQPYSNNLTARPSPDIYAILNSTEDPPIIEEPIDTDALVKDIFSTNYASPLHLPCTEFNFNHGKKKKIKQKKKN